MSEPTEKQKRISDLADYGMEQIAELCGHLNLAPSREIGMQFRVIMFGVATMIEKSKERPDRSDVNDRIAAIEKKWADRGINS